jgi:hypothetical protein
VRRPVGKAANGTTPICAKARKGPCNAMGLTRWTLWG